MRCILAVFIVFQLTSHWSFAEILVDTSQFEKDFYREFQKFDLDHVKTPELENLVKIALSSKVHLQDIPYSTNSKKCLVCRANSYTILKYFEANYTVPQLKNAAIELCTIFQVVGLDACKGFVEIFSPTIEFILRNTPKSKLTSERICAITAETSKCGPKFEEKKVIVKIDQNGPKAVASKPLIVTGKSQLTIVQITDPHYDPYYTAGGNAKCGDVACCGRFQGFAKVPEEAAGFWGDYRDCDTPKHAINDTLYQVQRQHEKIDYIYFTGDIVDHFVASTSVAGNVKSVTVVFQMLRDVFGDVPVFPIFGNHEAHPVNLYPPTSVSAEYRLDWLYDLSKSEWKNWIPEADLELLSKGGYYTTLVRPGLRVIALNSNFAYFDNYWLLYDDECFVEQLQWLHDTLLAAEQNNEKVHILSHVPSNGGMYHKYSYNYNLIVERFFNTIAAQFNGHTHMDEFNLYYASNNKDIALNVAWNGGSVTAFVDVNPNYSVYDIDGGSFEVLDKTTWIYNLTEANTVGIPRWFKEYSFKESFNVDLSPASLNTLIDRFMEDKALLRKYFTFKVKMGDPLMNSGCQENDKCLMGHLCEIVLSDFHVRPYCQSEFELHNNETTTHNMEL